MYFWVKTFPGISENQTNDPKKIPFFSSSIFVPTIFLTAAILILHKFYYQSLARYPTAASIPASLFNSKHVLLGVVTSGIPELFIKRL